MFLYRLTRKKHAHALDGEGSRINGGRWNNAGIPCIYTSESRALAVLEYAVNATIDDIPHDLCIITFSVSEHGHNIYRPLKLPEEWNNTEISENTRNWGTLILGKAEHLIIRLPSVIIPQEYNYLINPAHPTMKELAVVDVSDFSFDTRLKK